MRKALVGLFVLVLTRDVVTAERAFTHDRRDALEAADPLVAVDSPWRGPCDVLLAVRALADDL